MTSVSTAHEAAADPTVGLLMGSGGRASRTQDLARDGLQLSQATGAKVPANEGAWSWGTPFRFTINDGDFHE